MNAKLRAIAFRAFHILRATLLGLGLFGAIGAAHGETFTVTNVNDAGPGSLRDAIEKSNQTPLNADTIAFSIPGAGPHTIAPLSALPTITSPVVIDGYTQHDASPNTDANGDNAVLQVALDGSAAGKDNSGLAIAAGGSRVSGLAIHRFTGAGILLAGTGGIVITGNFIGTDATGLKARPNFSGVEVAPASSDNTIGGSDPQSRNLISGNVRGIRIEGANRTKIEGNFIGTDRTGGAKLSNDIGMQVFSTKSTSIGGTSPGQRNVISGNSSHGMWLAGGSEGLIAGNFIGTDAAGTGALGNALYGILMSSYQGGEGERNWVVGGIAAGAANVIAHNGVSGIVVGAGISANPAGISIRGNRIFKNAQLGIDLIGGGVTQNDPAPDADMGPNRLQNFPILASVEASGAGIKIEGSLTSVPNTAFHIDLYGNEERDPSGHGEGQFYLGTVDVTTDGKGVAAFQVTLPATQGTWISSTATRVGNFADTSEFSPLVARAGKEFGVNNTNPSGPGSLAQALADSNATNDPLAVNNIRFNIPGAGVITPTGTLKVTQPVVIDGYTQPGATAPTPLIGVDGVNVTNGPVLDISGSNVTLRGLAMLRHDPSGNIGAVQSTGNGNWFLGNLFGITPGNSEIPNRVGLSIFGEDNRIGGPDAADRNVVSGNTIAGIGLGTGALRTLVQGNHVGTDSTATANRGNKDSGILVSGAQQSSIIDNVVAFNTIRGVSVSGTATGNWISRNSMFGNGIGIDLAPPNGADTNDPGDADERANGGQNYPDLASASIVGSVTVAGSLGSTPASAFTLEFFVSPTCSPTGFGEGKTSIGVAAVTTDDAGNAAFSVTLPDTVVAGQVITATATDAFGSTSEFSRCMTISSAAPPPSTVVSLLAPKTANGAPGSTHTLTVTLTAGGAPVANVPVAFTVVSGPNVGQAGTVTTDGSGRANFGYASDGSAGEDTITAIGVATGVQFATSATMAWGPGGSTEVVEYYHSALDHYFITWMPNEIGILDAGTTIKGWTRTGYVLRTYVAAQADTSPICRYYIPPELGDSHFFGRGTAECMATGQNNPSFTLEDPAFMQMYLPNQGICPAGTRPIYRVFSNRTDANHRYMTDKAIRDQMVANGWLAEGDGPDLVVMCAPQ